MSVLRSVLVILLVTASLFAEEIPTQGKISPEGTLTANGKTIQFSYVYAYAEKKGFYDEMDATWSLLFVENPIEEADLADHVWDSIYVRIGITQTSEFDDEAKIQVYSQSLRISTDTGGNISGGTYPQIELSNTGPDRLSGRVYLAEAQEFFDDTFQYDFTFDVPLSDPFAPIGDPLPQDGGAPGAAYRAWTEAVQAGDIEKLKTLVPAEQATMLDDEGFAEELGFLQSMTPTDVEITEGSSDGKTAILMVIGKMDGEKVEGEITLVLMDGRWMATEASW